MTEQESQAAEKQFKFINPPPWRPNTTYQDWKTDVRLWEKFSKIDKCQRGYLVYTCLPTENQAHEKVRLSIQNDELQIDRDDAVNEILKILDKSYLKDDLCTAYETWSMFKNIEKSKVKR